MNATASPTRETSKAANASFVFGILSLALVCIGPLFALPALVLGHVALRKKTSRRGFAVSGLVCGYLSVILFFAVALPWEIRSMQHERQLNAKVCFLKRGNLQAAKRQWAEAHQRSPSDTPTFADLDYASSNTICPSGGTIRLNSVAESPTCSVSGHSTPVPEPASP